MIVQFVITEQARRILRRRRLANIRWKNYDRIAIIRWKNVFKAHSSSGKKAKTIAEADAVVIAADNMDYCTPKEAEAKIAECIELGLEMAGE